MLAVFSGSPFIFSLIIFYEFFKLHLLAVLICVVFVWFLQKSSNIYVKKPEITLWPFLWGVAVPFKVF